MVNEAELIAMIAAILETCNPEGPLEAARSVRSAREILKEAKSQLLTQAQADRKRALS